MANAWRARSAMTGMPSGRFSSLPGLGIQTRRTGWAFGASGFVRISLARSSFSLVSQRRKAVYARCPLALVVLSHPTHRQKSRASGLDQESLEFVDRLRVTTT